MDLWNEQRSAPYKHMESLPARSWRTGRATTSPVGITGRLSPVIGKRRLLSFIVAGLLGAIVISLLQTSNLTGCVLLLKFRATSFFWSPRTEMNTGGNYASAEFVRGDPKSKLLQSESLLEHVVDRLKLQNEQAKIRFCGAFTSRIHRMLQFSDPSGLPEREKLIPGDRAQFNCSHIGQLRRSAGSDI